MLLISMKIELAHEEPERSRVNSFNEHPRMGDVGVYARLTTRRLRRAKLWLPELRGQPCYFIIGNDLHPGVCTVNR